MSCYTCLKAKLEKKLSWVANADAAFTDKGYTNWKDATVRFSAHEASSCHKEAVLKVTTLPASTPDVAMCLSSQHQKDCLERRQMFLKNIIQCPVSSTSRIAIQGTRRRK